MNENLCRKCKKKININEYSMFNGLCEKCYNKWIKKKDNRYINKKNENSSQNSISYIAILLGIISFSCSILILLILFILSIPYAFIMILDFISIPNLIAQYGNKFYSIFIIIKIIEIVSCFSLVFNVLVRRKEQNSMTKIGLILSSITVMIWMTFRFI